MNRVRNKAGLIWLVAFMYVRRYGCRTPIGESLCGKTSKTPCLAMNERARKRKSVFGVASMPGLSGFRDNKTGHARANVVTLPPTLVNLVTIGSLITHQILAQLATRILRYGDGGARAHVQRTCTYPTPPMTCGKHILSDLQPTYQI